MKSLCRLLREGKLTMEKSKKQRQKLPQSKIKFKVNFRKEVTVYF